MVAVGDHLRIKDFQTMDNVAGDVMNVYFYEVLSITTPVPLSLIADELEAWFYGLFLTAILDIQTASVQHVRVEIDNMDDFLTDSVVIIPAVPVPGAIADNFAASSTAASFQLVRQNRTTRHGSKRIAGVPDNTVTNNVIIPASEPVFLDAAASMASAQSFLVGVGNTLSMVPVIAKTPVPPATLPTVYNNVIDATFRGIGSQTSRKQLLS